MLKLKKQKGVIECITFLVLLIGYYLFNVRQTLTQKKNFYSICWFLFLQLSSNSTITLIHRNGNEPILPLNIRV